MSKRLDSLNSKKPSTAPKTSLKFKPKTVVRKSKEEREKGAPALKDEHPASTSIRGRGSTRARGRGGRANYAGTHVVSAGPLASGSVSMGNHGGSKTGFSQDRTYNNDSRSSTPSFLQNLKLKNEPNPKSRETTPGISHENESDEDEDDFTRINMNKPYRYADEETILFPVRPNRREESSSSNENTPAPESKEATPEAESDSSVDSRIKSEPIEDKLEKIKAHKAEIESKISEPVDLLDKEEHDKILDDYQKILEMVTDKIDSMSASDESPDDKYVLIHLPKVLPKYTKASEAKEDSPEAIDQDDEDSHSKNVKQEGNNSQAKNVDEEVRTTFASHVPNLEGQIGHLNIHKSGKITMNLGNDNNLSVAQGVPSNFLQELIVLDIDQEEHKPEDAEMLNEDGLKVKGNMFRIGQVDGKIIGTPLLL